MSLLELVTPDAVIVLVVQPEFKFLLYAIVTPLEGVTIQYPLRYRIVEGVIVEGKDTVVQFPVKGLVV